MNKFSKNLVVVAVLLGLASQQSFGQGAQGAMITKRAREVVNQNNVRQGISQPPPSVAAPTTQPGQRTAASPAQTQQQSINKIRADVAALLGSAQLSQEKVQKFSTDLLLAARGPKKPSPAAIYKLASNIASNLSGQTLGSAEQLRLAQNLEAVVNASGMSQMQADAYVSDVQAVLQVAGVKRAAAVKSADDIKAVLSELRH